MRAIFTNDDAGGSANPQSVEWFQTVVEWLDGLGIHATFFWVPKPGGFERCHEVWRPALLEARDQGHDFQLHGLTHGSCLEFGVPQPSTRRANSKPFDDYEANRDHWEAEHARDSLRAKLEEGALLFESVFGDRPRVFRAPCFGVCPAMYEALADVDLRFSSSRGINPTATAYTILRDPSLRRWAPDFPCTPWVEPPGVTEVPCVEDLCIAGVPPEDFDDRLDLCLSEWRHVADEAGADGVLVLGSHYHSMMRTWEQTRPLLERGIEWLAEQGVDEWATFGEYVAPAYERHWTQPGGTGRP